MSETIETKVCRSCGKTYKKDQDFLESTYQWRLCTNDNLWFNCACGSTLMIRKGKFPWYDPTASLSAPAKSVFNQLKISEKVPYISSSVMELQILLSDEKTENSDFVAAVKREPLLASELISLANSLRQSRAPESLEIKTIDHAIGYIGRDKLSDFILTVAIKTFTLETTSFTAKEFWEHAFIRGAIAEHLVKDLNLPIEKDQAFLAGALCNVGKIIGAMLLPKEMDEIHSTVNNPSSLSTWKEAEISFPKLNHSILGEIGCALWGLPPYIMESARFHHRPVTKKNSLSGKESFAELCGLANSLTHWINLEPSRIDQEHLLSLCAGFGIEEYQLEELATRYTALKYAVEV